MDLSLYWNIFDEVIVLWQHFSLDCHFYDDLFARQLSWLSFHLNWCFNHISVEKATRIFPWIFSTSITSNSMSRRVFDLFVEAVSGGQMVLENSGVKQSRCGNWKISEHFRFMRDYQVSEWFLSRNLWIFKEIVLIWLDLQAKLPTYIFPGPYHITRRQTREISAERYRFLGCKTSIFLGITSVFSWPRVKRTAMRFTCYI